MGTYKQTYWFNTGEGQSRKERAGGSYTYFLPDKLNELDIVFHSDVVKDITNAENALSQLSSNKKYHSTEGIARLLIRAEAISSSYIEGLSISAQKVLMEEMRYNQNNNINNSIASDIVGNIHAMEYAVNNALKEARVSSQTIKNIHYELCKNSRAKKYAGQFRTVQNWVGGNAYNPLNAVYVPPAPEYVESLIEDLCDFINSKNVSTIVKAAIAHAQLETIHPFADGNGRTGRALIHLILKKDGLCKKIIPPISMMMATYNKDYILGLTEFRNGQIEDWVSTFCGFTIKSCNEINVYEDELKSIENNWRKSFDNIRAGSSLDMLLSELAAIPVFNIDTIMPIVNTSFAAINSALDLCLKQGILTIANNNKRNRIFLVPDVLQLINKFEEHLLP